MDGEKVSLLDALQKRLTEIGGCTDGYCIVVKHKGGQHTNGGCQCSRDQGKMQRVIHAYRQFADAIRALPGEDSRG